MHSLKSHPSLNTIREETFQTLGIGTAGGRGQWVCYLDGGQKDVEKKMELMRKNSTGIVTNIASKTLEFSSVLRHCLTKLLELCTEYDSETK